MDYGLFGAGLGFALAAVEVVVLWWLAARIERQVDTPTAALTARLLRIAAVLGLVLAVGLGYLLGRFWG